MSAGFLKERKTRFLNTNVSECSTQKDMVPLSVLATLVAFCQIITVAETQTCPATGSEESILGWMLQKHIYRTMRANIGIPCALICREDVRCQSLNFVMSLRRCEFSNRTKEARPEDFVPDPDRYYFRRDINRVPLGSIPELAAVSCQEIKASEGQVVSAKYWLSTIKPGTAVLAYCDMKTGDVDECTAVSPSICDANASCTNTLGSYTCTCKPGYIGDGKTCRVGRNCAELYKSGERNSGVYTIDPDGSGAFDVFCDQATAGGGWTVFQKRLDGSVDFYRGWSDYKIGFGNLSGEYWLGLDKIHRLTKLVKNTLRVELEDTEGKTAYAAYDMFAVSSEKTDYQLSLGTYSGTAGDSLSFQRDAAFSTKDKDNDQDSSNCAVVYKGAWWYTSCHESNLNGRYHHGQHSSFGDGVNWHSWKGYNYSVKKAEMKIRPVGF
ncbi:microfibril-associated glycoprotein 4-like [Montipora foliosa]|uniref:microfibril-associated glycoprotein 4-like n=1 Tax=Montipora foliosa TaxID=591990 RepID=UPI0035F1C136